MKLEVTLGSQIVDPSLSFHTVIPKDKWAVGFFHILSNCFLDYTDIQLGLVAGPRGSLLENTHRGHNLRTELLSSCDFCSLAASDMIVSDAPISVADCSTACRTSDFGRIGTQYWQHV